MEALEAILTRRCVRNFAPTRIPPEELLEKVAEAGTFAPSGMGRQAGLIVKTIQSRIPRPFCGTECPNYG